MSIWNEYTIHATKNPWNLFGEWFRIELNCIIAGWSLSHTARYSIEDEKEKRINIRMSMIPFQKHILKNQAEFIVITNVLFPENDKLYPNLYVNALAIVILWKRHE